MAVMPGAVALLEQSLCHGISQNVSSSTQYAKGIPMLTPPSRRVRSRVTVGSATNHSGSARGASIKANAVATVSPPGLSKSAGAISFSTRESAEKTTTAPSWAILTEEISIGPCPRSPKDLELLVKNTNSTAFVFLETAEGCKNLGLDWEKFREKASQQGVVAVRVAMKNDDQQDQASSLPEAVRAVAALSALGYKVHISCTSGIHRSPLVALGYLTFVKSMEFTQAVQLISTHNPAAQPSFDSWEEAKTKISAGDMKRVAQLAQEVSQKRLQSKKAGTPADDWLVAQRLLVAEAFERGISTDVTLSDAIAKAATTRATKSVLEELTVTKIVAEKAKSSAMSSQERLEFFERQLHALKEKEESARTSAVVAVKDKEALSREVETLKVREEQATRGAETAREQVAVLTAKVAELEETEVALKAAADSANEKAKELQVLMHSVAEREAAAKKELINANAKVYTLSAKYAAMEASLADARVSKDHASDRVKEVLTQIESVNNESLDSESMASRVSELARKEAAAHAALSSANERHEFFLRQMQTLKTKEQTARDAVKVANEKARKMSVKMQELSRREMAAMEATRAANDQVAAMKLQIVELEKSLAAAKEEAAPLKAAFEAKVKEAVKERTGGAIKEMQSELFMSRKRESQARDSVVAANDRIEFFHRRMELMKQREEKAKMATEQRISLFTQQAAELRAKLTAAESLAAEHDKKIEMLSTQVHELHKKEEAAQEAAKAAGERIEFFTRQVDQLKVKEAAARQAATAATEKAKFLQKKVDDLEKREALAIAQAEKMNEKMATLLQINTELGLELEEVKDREIRLADALDEGTGMLQIALEADETIQQLRQEAEKAAQELLDSRLRADKLASELERELMAAGKRPRGGGGGSSSEIELQLQAQMATMQHSLSPPQHALSSISGGSAVATMAVEQPDNQFNLVRNFVLGALGVAAVPFTLMSAFSGNPSGMIGSLVNNDSSTADQLMTKPIVQPASAEDFCRQVPPGARSARADKFCSTVFEVSTD